MATSNGTCQPDVTDLLLVGIRAALTDQTIFVTDGFPGTNIPTVLVSVGGTPELTADGAESWAYLGAKRKWDKYKLLIIVSVGLGGDGQQSEVPGADAQKTARDLAYQAVHAIEAFLLADPTLGQFFNTGRMQGGWVGLEEITLLQTDVTTAADGVLAEVQMKLSVTALI